LKENTSTFVIQVKGRPDKKSIKCPVESLQVRDTTSEELRLSASPVGRSYIRGPKTSQISLQGETLTSNSLSRVLNRPQASQIYFQEEILTNSTCATKVEGTTPSMVIRTVSSPASTAVRMDSVEVGLEQIVTLPTFTGEQLLLAFDNTFSATSLLEAEMETSTGSRPYRDFNSPIETSTLNTPDISTECNISNFDETFSRLLEENTYELQGTFNSKNEPISMMIETNNNCTVFNNDNQDQPTLSPMMEDIWGGETFESEVLGLCLPAAEVEGVAADQVGIVEPEVEKELDIDNQDLLKWIINDQQIDDLTHFNLSPEEDIKPAAIPSPEPVPEFFIEIKEEAKLKDDEKYRKMRDQNNKASRTCRANRKRKLVEVEKEAVELEARNKFLRTQLADMEAEVARWKEKLLSDIKTKSFSSRY